LILNRIVGDKRGELERTISRLPLVDIKARAADAPVVRDFAGGLRIPGRVAIIAEVKKASPSKGLIRADFNPVNIAKAYEANGAAAISVLTESNYFQGSIEFLRAIREAGVGIPLLRKDFIFDPYQVYEARANGADAFLLIASILDVTQMTDLYALGRELGMEVLAEAHDGADLDKITSAGFRVVGINNRDLKSFSVDINTTGRLKHLVPKGSVLVSESGISTIEDIKRVREIGADAALIGEAIMREKDFGAKLKELAEA